MTKRATKEYRNGVLYSVLKLEPGELLGAMKEGDEQTIQDSERSSIERRVAETRLENNWSSAEAVDPTDLRKGRQNHCMGYRNRRDYSRYP